MTTKTGELLAFLSEPRTGPEIRAALGDVRIALYRLRKEGCVASTPEPALGVMVYWLTGHPHSDHAARRANDGHPRMEKKRALIRDWFERNREHRNAYMREYRAKKKLATQ